MPETGYDVGVVADAMTQSQPQSNDGEDQASENSTTVADTQPAQYQVGHWHYSLCGILTLCRDRQDRTAFWVWKGLVTAPSASWSPLSIPVPEKDSGEWPGKKSGQTAGWRERRGALCGRAGLSDILSRSNDEGYLAG